MFRGFSSQQWHLFSRRSILRRNLFSTEVATEGIAEETKVARFLTVSIVGRPNTGKSTLYNRLTKSKSAIVSSIPGTTRDRKEGVGYLIGVPLNVIDTGGLDETGEMNQNIRKQVEKAVFQSDIILFLVDGRAGVTPVDEKFAQWIRKNLFSPSKSKGLDSSTSSIERKMPKVILALNKTEGARLSDAVIESIAESCRLGFGEPLMISATHGEGMADLGLAFFEEAKQRGLPHETEIGKADRRKAAKVMKRREERRKESERANKKSGKTKEKEKEKEINSSSALGGEGVGAVGEEAMEITERISPEVARVLADSNFKPVRDNAIQIAIMGRPNVGKSTLLNALIGEERVITGPLPGLTRDAISVEWQAHDRLFRLIDTAGLTRVRTNTDLLTEVPVRRHESMIKILESKSSQASIMLPGKNLVSIEENPSQFSEQISEMSLISSLQALKYAQVVLVVVESAQGQFQKIDLQLIKKCYEEGRSVIVIANKSDLLQEKSSSSSQRNLDEYEKQVSEHIKESIHSFQHDLPVIACSALTREGLSRILSQAIHVHDQYSKKLPTWVLNEWLKDVLVTLPTFRDGAKTIQCKYMLQSKTRPPTFLLFTNVLEIPIPLERFILNQLQKDFQFQGIPLRLEIKKSKGREVKKELLSHGKQRRRGAGQGEFKGKFKKIEVKDDETVVDRRGKVFYNKRLRRMKINVRRRRDTRLRGKRKVPFRAQKA
jgi:GTP-binding protein